MKKILVNIAIIVVVVALSAAATWAYFGSANQETSTTITTAQISLGNATKANLPFGPLIPGETSDPVNFAIQNTGDRAADFYFQLLGDEPPGGSGEINVGDVLTIWVHEMTDNTYGTIKKTWFSNQMAKELYPGDLDTLTATLTSIMPKIANDVPVGAYVYYQIQVQLDVSATSELMGGTNTDVINFVAVQFDGTPPQPSHAKDGYWDAYAWPVNDGNYSSDVAAAP